MAKLRVLVETGGKPVAGASVKMWCTWHSRSVASAKTGKDGKATLESRWEEEVDVYVDDELRNEGLHLSRRDEDDVLELSG